MLRKHMIVLGRVQGVGFRYTACVLARRLGLTGWVRNCPDGTVEMEAQGTEADINCLLSMLGKEQFIRIDRVEARVIPVVREKSFEERY